MATPHVHVARHGVAGTPVAEPPTRMLVDLADATAATSGPKASSPAVLLQHGLPALRRGDVLVCRETDVAWTPLFGLVAAVVTETGGLLSHAAIVARELGVPAVLAVPGATTAVRDGAILEVDGTRGRVSLVVPAPG